jgi:hypothetical protein
MDTYYCPCRTVPTVSHALASLSGELRRALGSLRQYSAHGYSGNGGGGGGGDGTGGVGGAGPNAESDLRCAVYRRMTELLKFV